MPHTVNLTTNRKVGKCISKSRVLRAQRIPAEAAGNGGEGKMGLSVAQDSLLEEYGFAGQGKPEYLPRSGERSYGRCGGKDVGEPNSFECQ